jgi:signal transduction histidine kinase
MSIRTRLLLIALLATALPALLVLARFLQDRSAAIESDTARLALIAQNHAQVLLDRIRGTAQLHYGLARASDLASGDRAACSAFLSEVREAYPQYTGILTVRPDGRLFCDSLKTGRELDLNDRGYFKAALATRGEVVLEPVFGRLTGVPVLQVAYPVRNAGGELQFVLLASLNLQKLGPIETAAVPQAQSMLVDHKGTVLAILRADGTSVAGGGSIVGSPLLAFAAASGGPTTAAIEGADGQVMRWTLANRELTRAAGLYVLAGAPESALVAGANERFGQDMALLASAAVILFLVVWLFSEAALRRQIARIGSMARRLTHGDLAARITPPLPRGELGALMAELNQTAQSLQDQRDELGSLNARLQQSQRLQAIGQLTGGVAHDFNNLLTVVLGNAELLAEQTQGAQRELAEMIVQAAGRGAELTQQLLAFARKQALDPRPTDVNQLVAGLDPMLRRTLGEHIEIESVRGAGLWPAMVDPGQLENALLNLCLNARDAMAEGGRLTIETANASLDRAYADRFPDVTPGQYVMIAVSDTGHGIAPEHLDKVFEPFFTTKEKGKGTGLGLAMVYGFIKQSAGHLNIYSEPGQGTTLKLYLPRAAKAEPRGPGGAGVAGEASDSTATTAAPVLRGGRETVLVVEDDALVRRYACNELASLGYRVLDADSGARALAVLRERDDVDLLFTDIVMPGGLSGRDLADEALVLRPRLRVLYTSGYSENAIVHHGRLDPGVNLLAKPYRRAELARAVREALGPA